MSKYFSDSETQVFGTTIYLSDRDKVLLCKVLLKAKGKTKLQKEFVNRLNLRIKP